MTDRPGARDVDRSQRSLRLVDEAGVLIDGLPVYHLVARIERSDVVLCDFEIATWVWARLRAAFPTALGNAMMPTHLHSLVSLRDPAAARERINRMLGRLACRLGFRRLGEAAEPKRITDRPKLLRDLRYIALNAPRDGLTRDPLGWLFSTHRDVIGATIDPWVTADRLARAVGRRVDGFVDWYHRYVSSDPSVRVDGSPLPRPAKPTEIAARPLAAIAHAVAAALRTRPEAIRQIGLARDLFVGLAREQGWTAADRLASACACTTRGINKIVARVDPLLLAPVRLCLGDARLRQGVPPWGGR